MKIKIKKIRRRKPYAGSTAKHMYIIQSTDGQRYYSNSPAFADVQPGEIVEALPGTKSGWIKPYRSKHVYKFSVSMPEDAKKRLDKSAKKYTQGNRSALISLAVKAFNP